MKVQNSTRIQEVARQMILAGKGKQPQVMVSTCTGGGGATGPCKCS